MKSKTTALLLSILLGGLGVDRFYLGYTGMGILKLLTAGCFGVLYILDIINIATGKLTPADGSRYDEDFIVTSAPAQQTTSPYDELEKIAKLHNAGVLSDEEFSKMKADLLGNNTKSNYSKEYNKEKTVVAEEDKESTAKGTVANSAESKCAEENNIEQSVVVEEGKKRILFCRKCGFVGSSNVYNAKYFACPKCKNVLFDTNMLESDFLSKTAEEKSALIRSWMS